ncbi:MAG TPA: MBL fold metallo-hydrolase [Solirubrobacteraceae bacterium]|nr:MBL fold metallo-hydrolase [Solirubrobacteraceae bacterium]
MTDAEQTLARAAEQGVHCLAIPTPFAVGRVNCYLVEDDPLTLLDAGPNSATSLTAMEAALAERGHRVEDLRRIVVTHQHIDHIGLVQILAKRSGAEVCALDRLAPWLADYKREMEENDGFSATIMLRYGIPQDVVYALRAVSASFRGWGAAAHVTRPLAEGELLEFASRSWRVLHRPGHSPSDTVFWDEASGELFGGDHLLKRISSNPLLSKPLAPLAPAAGASEGQGVDASEGQGADVPRPPGSAQERQREAIERPRALMAYLDSLRRTREMELNVVFAGHGEPVEDHRGLIEERFRMHERRAEKLLALIAERPRNAYELAQQMWGNVAVTQAFLTLSEVVGHVDLLIDDGRVLERELGGVVRFEVS